MADKTDDLVIGVSTDLSSVQRSIRKLDGDIARWGGQIERQFAAVGKGIDRAMPAAVQDRINKMVGIQTAATKEWTGALAEQGKELERLRARFNPIFSTISSYKSAIGEIRAAHRLGAISADEMAAAIQRERQAALSSIAAIKQRNAALSDTPNPRGAPGSFNTSNLAAQGFDIVATAGFMPWYTVALQQGPQVAQVFNDIKTSGSSIGPAVSAAFMQLINPVSLVTIGVIAASAAVIQYGLDVFSSTEDSAEALQKQAQLIQQVAQRWGDAIPALKEYADELQRAQDAALLDQGVADYNEKTLATVRASIEDARGSIGALVQDLQAAGEDASSVTALQDAFNQFAAAADKGEVSADDVKRVTDALAAAIASSGIPALVDFASMFDQVSAAALRASDSVQKMATTAGQARMTDPRTWRSRNPVTGDVLPGLSPDGRIQGGFQLPENGPAPDRRPSELGMYPGGSWNKGRSGGTKTPKQTADDRFFEDIEAIKQRTVALAEERAQLGLSYEAQQKRRTAFDLEQKALKDVREEARKKGDQDWRNAQLTPEQIRQIDETSAAYARQADELRKAQNNLAFQKDLMRGALGDLKSALADGKLEWEEFGQVAGNVLDKITDKLLDDVVNALFEVNRAGAMGGGGGDFLGFLGGIFGGGGQFGIASSGGLGLYDSGGYTGPGGKNQPAGIVHKGEVVFSQADVARTGGVAAVEALRRGYANGGPVGVRAPTLPKLTQNAAASSVVVHFSPTINAPGADAAGLAQVRQELRQMKTEIGPLAVKAVQSAKGRGYKGL